MASRIVRKVKRVKRDSFLNDLKENAPVGTTMKVAANLLEGKNVTIKPAAEMAEFNVSQLIAELSENTKVPKIEIENIQRRLLQQANEILKVNAFANSTNQPVPEPRIVNTTQKYDNNKPVYGRPIQRHDQDVRYNSMVARDNQLDPQLVPEKLEMSPDGACGMINGGGNGNMLRVGTSPAQGTRGFFYGTGSATARLAASARAAPIRGTVEGVPPYRMPPAPEALPGAPAPSVPAALHTHSNKFPIEREVILSSGDKNSKVPILQEARKRGRLGAVAPDTPPKTLSAWTHAENQQAGPSGDFRQYQDYAYAMHQTQNPRNIQNYDSPKPPVPAKTYKDVQNNSQMITVTVETGKDNTRDAPKSSKSVSKTYHTLKDMISSRFKSKDSEEKNNEPEASLNNSEERKRPEPEQVTPRDNGTRKPDQGIYGRPVPQNRPEAQTRPEVQNRPEVQRPEMLNRPEILNRPEMLKRPETQNRPEMQYNHGMPNNMAYPSPSPHRQLMQQQLLQQQQLLLSQQARSQEMLASTHQHARSQEMLAAPHRPQALGADALYQQYGPPGRRSAMYQRDLDVRSIANFTSLKSGPQSQFEHHSRADLRSPQQLEREVVRQRGLVDRRATSHPHLLDEPPQRPELTAPQHDMSRRNSHGNILDPKESPRRSDERESDDGGFRGRLQAQGKSSLEERMRTSGRSIESTITENAYRRTPESHKERRTPESHKERRTPDMHKERRTPDSHKERRTPDLHKERRTPDNHKERRTPDSIAQKQRDEGTSQHDESGSQKSADSVYNSSGKAEAFHPQPSSSRHTPSRIEDLKAHGKKAGSGASSDYDKSGGQSSNVDSGRGSVAYSSGRRPEASLHDTSVDSDAAASRVPPQPGPSQQVAGPSGENEWADLVECELRQILEPKLASMRLDSSGSSDSSVTPPLPPLSPSSDMHKRNSLPGRASEYTDERRRGRDSPRWHAHKKHSSKRDHHYKKHLFGLDTTDMTSTTTRSLDLSSLLDARSDSEGSRGGAGDARAIRRQLRGLENMYGEVLQLLGVRRPPMHAHPTWEPSLDLSSMLDARSDSEGSRGGAGDARAIRRQLRVLENMYGEVLQLLEVRRPPMHAHPTWEPRLSSKRRYGSMSSLPSSSVSSRPAREKRRSSNEHRKKHDLKGINKRFQRLESHVVTLARSVAHLSSEMRTHHLLVQEIDNIRAEIAALRHMYKSQNHIRSGHARHADPFSFSNPERVKRLTKFFGDEPPLMRLFLKKLGYEKYAALLEKEKVGAAELPYVGEDKLRALGVPLGPRMRILKEAGIHQELHHISRDDHHNTTTTLAIV